MHLLDEIHLNLNLEYSINMQLHQLGSVEDNTSWVGSVLCAPLRGLPQINDSGDVVPWQIFSRWGQTIDRRILQGSASSDQLLLFQPPTHCTGQ